MHYFRAAIDGEEALVVRDRENDLFDLSGAHGELTSFRYLATVSDMFGREIESVTRELLDSAPMLDGDAESRIHGTGPEHPSRPVVPDEVWAAGVTYEISSDAREEESDRGELYQDVFEAERPEIFFKATPSRTVGPGEAIGVRSDSDWNVPEPELAVVCYRGEIVGYTVGNDVSSRDIEGNNPLYLPQAKVYDRCCAIGPCVASTETVADPLDLEISMEIRREGELVFDGVTSTSKMVRSPEELVSYLTRHNAVPELAVLLTGTSLVPDESFSLREGDRVSIEIESIGRLENPVVSV